MTNNPTTSSVLNRSNSLVAHLEPTNPQMVNLAMARSKSSYDFSNQPFDHDEDSERSLLTAGTNPNTPPGSAPRTPVNPSSIPTPYRSTLAVIPSPSLGVRVLNQNSSGKLLPINASQNPSPHTSQSQPHQQQHQPPLELAGNPTATMGIESPALGPISAPEHHTNPGSLGRDSNIPPIRNNSLQPHQEPKHVAHIARSLAFENPSLSNPDTINLFNLQEESSDTFESTPLTIPTFNLASFGGNHNTFADAIANPQTMGHIQNSNNQPKTNKRAPLQ